MRRPPALPPGGHIRVVSPGLPTLGMVPARARRAERELTALGFTVSFGSHAHRISADLGAAGDAAGRARDITDAFCDPSVDAILAADGGRATLDVVALLNRDDIVDHPKPVLGYCDNVFLNQYLATEASLGSFLGCCFMVHFGEAGGTFPETRERFRAALMTDGPLHCMPAATRTNQWTEWLDPADEPTIRRREVPGGWNWIRDGHARGRLIGGEIASLPLLVRTFDLRPEGAVLFWDVTTVNNRPLREQLEEVLECFDLTRLRGMIVGAHTQIPPPAWAEMLRTVLDELTPGVTYPVLANADLSHLSPAWIVPYADDVDLNSEHGVVFRRDG